jgi:flagellar motor switch protein FliN/FliY
MPEASPAPPPNFVPEGAASGPGAAGAVRALADAFVAAAGPALTTKLNQSITATVGGVGKFSPPALPGQVPPPWVVIKLPYARGLPGAHALIMPVVSAIALARAAAGDAAAEGGSLTSAGEEALKQALGEVLTAVAGPLGTAVKRSVAFGPVALTLAENPAALPSDVVDARDAGWSVRLLLSGDDALQVPVVLTVSSAIAQEIGGAAPAPAAAAMRADADATRGDHGPARLDLILDISLPVTVELGRARMQIQDILKLGPGSIIELEKSAGDPVELLINDRPIAKGEVVVIDENFGIRLTSIVTASERIRTLR